MNPEIQQVAFNQADIAKLLPEITSGIVSRPAESASPNGSVLFEELAGHLQMIGLIRLTVLGHIPGQFLQTDHIKITERLYVLQYARKISATITRFSVLNVPGKNAHSLDAGMHE
jgi:hypothetical protein